MDQGSEFYNKSFKKRLEDNDTKMYSIYNEGKSVVAEIFMIIFKRKIYKHMTAATKMFILMCSIILLKNIIIHIITLLKWSLLMLNTIQYNIDPDVKDPKFSIGGLYKNLKLQKRFC